MVSGGGFAFKLVDKRGKTCKTMWHLSWEFLNYYKKQGVEVSTSRIMSTFALLLAFGYWHGEVLENDKMRYWITTLLLLTLVLHPLSAQTNALHIAILGDSNTWLGGDDCSKPRGWNKWFRDAMRPASIRSYARSGATWTNTPNTRRNTVEDIGRLGDDNVIMNQLFRLEEAMDEGRQVKPGLILIAAGTNDVWFQDKRPHVFEDADTSLLTLNGVVEYCCRQLRQRCPEARIVLITPMQTIKADTADIHRAGDIIEACGQKLDIPVIRLDYHSKVKSQSERRAFRYTYDGTHTNEQGARSNGDYIAEEVRALIAPVNHE